jgi:hypothetical protein
MAQIETAAVRKELTPLIRLRPRRRRWGRAGAFAALAAAGSVGTLLCRVPDAEAAGIANAQIGTAVQSVAGSVTPTLPNSSSAGNLLVASLADSSSGSSFGAPAGWARAATVDSTSGHAEIWYYANNPGGISSAAFSAGLGLLVFGQLSEWSGVATSSPVDVTGTATASSSGQVAVSSTAPASIIGDLGITAMDISSTLGTPSFSPGTGWNNLGTSGVLTGGYAGDYQLAFLNATVSETENSTVSGNWAAAVVAFKPAVPCSGRTLTLGAPSSVSFGSTTLSGLDQTLSASVSLSPNDLSGSGSGWNITGTSTTFTNGSGNALPTTAATVTAASATGLSGNCSLPSNTVSYPATVPAGSTPPTATRLYNAAAGSGAGPVTVALTANLTVPAAVRTGSYSSTWTLSIVSGP